MKLTELGKELRKIRIGRDEVLFDMAKKLQISSAMLSAIETGSKAAPESLIERLANHYNEVSDERQKFEHLAELTKKQIKLSLEDASTETKDAACAFARYLPQLTAQDVEAITGILEKYRNSNDKKNEGRNM